MATVMTHSVLALILGRAGFGRVMPVRFWLLAVICSVLPDIDVIGFHYGIPYESLWGHRGITHSIPFALVLSWVVVFLFFSARQWQPIRWRLFAFFFLITASHGVLDAMTNGGLGIAFFAPFDESRYFFPVRPIAVSPISIRDFLTSSRSLPILQTEIVWIWVPALVIFATSWGVRKLRMRYQTES